MPVKLERILKRYDRAKTQKMHWEPLLEEAYAYALPQRNLIYDKHNTKGENKVTDRMFDSVGQTSAMKFINRVHTELMPPFEEWVQLEAGPMVPEAMRNEVNTQLQQANRQLFATLNASNFNVAIPEVLADLAVGTGAMLINQGTPTRPVQYVPVPLARVMLEEGAWGEISAVFRDWLQIEIRVIEEQWPEAEIPETLKQKQRADEGAEIDLIEATYQDGDQWVYQVIWRGDGKSTEPAAKLVERTYNSNPWVTPRWMKLAGEAYGRGPIIQALPDIKTKNKIVELVLRNAALNIMGVYTGVDDGVLNPNTVRIVPGAVIPVAANGGTRGESLKELRNPGQLDMAQIELEKLDMAIRQILLDDSLPPESGPVRSATEIIERVKRLVQDIGGPFGRIMHELVQPMVQRTLNILADRGLVPKIAVDGLMVKVQVLSPLAQSQKLSEVESVVRGLSVLAGFGQEILMLSAKMEDIGPWILEKTGVPAKLIRTEQDRAKLQKMAGALVAQQSAANENVPVGGSVTPQGVSVAGQAAGVPLAA